MELEPAFVLRKPLGGPNITVADVINAIEYALPAIEIIDSRVKDWAIGLPDTLADNGSTGAILLGGTPRRVTELNLGNTHGVLSFNDREIISGNTGNILGNPFAAIAWLVNRLAEYGVEFEPGQVILPGSCLKAVPMNEAGHWSGTFEGWGTIEFDVSPKCNSSGQGQVRKGPAHPGRSTVIPADPTTTQPKDHPCAWPTSPTG